MTTVQKIRTASAWTVLLLLAALPTVILTGYGDCWSFAFLAIVFINTVANKFDIESPPKEARDTIRDWIYSARGPDGVGRTSIERAENLIDRLRAAGFTISRRQPF